jgi:ankyrin repeat protein
LIHAASVGSKVEQILIDAGANIHFIDNDNRSALDYASMNGEKNVVNKLVSAGAKIEQDYEKRSAFFSAITGNHTQLAKQLKDYGANVNFVDREGKSALAYSACYKLEESAKFLIDHGADPNLIDN